MTCLCNVLGGHPEYTGFNNHVGIQIFPVFVGYTVTSPCSVFVSALNYSLSATLPNLNLTNHNFSYITNLRRED